MYFKSTSSTSPERAMTTWYSTMPELPYASSTFSRPGLIAPWWGYYSSYYCYDDSNTDCSVRYRVMPFEGKGTDVTSDLPNGANWDLIDSPIRINPSNDYLSIGGDVNIEPGVVIQQTTSSSRDKMAEHGRALLSQQVVQPVPMTDIVQIMLTLQTRLMQQLQQAVATEVHQAQTPMLETSQ